MHTVIFVRNNGTLEITMVKGGRVGVVNFIRDMYMPFIQQCDYDAELVENRLAVLSSGDCRQVHVSITKPENCFISMSEQFDSWERVSDNYLGLSDKPIKTPDIFKNYNAK